MAATYAKEKAKDINGRKSCAASITETNPECLHVFVSLPKLAA
jgi:hypothetical protein